MTQAASRQWLRIMMENQPITNRHYYLDHKVFTFLCISIVLILDAYVYGQLVCRRSFMRAYGISENKMQNYSSEDTLRMGRISSTPSIQANAWIKTFSEMVYT
jgi:hypothetical protein